MIGTSLGPFDPSGFDENNPATFPPEPAGGFQPGQFYVLTGPTTIGGVALVAGDRMYVTQGVGRLYGQSTWGDLTYGSDIWDPDYVQWLPFADTAPPWQKPAPPYAGCPFFPGQAFSPTAPQWRIVVEAWYLDSTNARAYGSLNYGDDLYGDVPGAIPMTWNDITDSSFAITIAVGDDEGGPYVPSTQITLEVIDMDEVWFPWSLPSSIYSPQINTPLRISLQDPQFNVWPLAVGKVERIEDEHDVPPRTVTVEAFGLLTDLVQNVTDWNRPSESALDRIGAAMVAAGWQWGDLDEHPATSYTLLADDAELEPRDLRLEVDRTALSTGWIVDCDKMGKIRARDWPLIGQGPAVVVADCPDDLFRPSIVTESMLLVADTAELLDQVTLENSNDPPDVGFYEDVSSIGKFGVHDNAYGFPVTGLTTATSGELDALAQRFVTRLGGIVNRVDTVTGNIAHDLAWLDVIAQMDTGQLIDVNRVGIPGRPVEIQAVVVGYEIRLTPGEATIDISTQSITRTG